MDPSSFTFEDLRPAETPVRQQPLPPPAMRPQQQKKGCPQPMTTWDPFGSPSDPTAPEASPKPWDPFSSPPTPPTVQQQSPSWDPFAGEQSPWATAAPVLSKPPNASSASSPSGCVRPPPLPPSLSNSPAGAPARAPPRPPTSGGSSPASTSPTPIRPAPPPPPTSATIQQRPISPMAPAPGGSSPKLVKGQPASRPAPIAGARRQGSMGPGLEELCSSTSSSYASASSAHSLLPRTTSPLRPVPANTAGAQAAPAEVDGMTSSEIDSWFSAADADGDGRLLGSEAVAFFEMTGLSKQDLSQVWTCVTGGKPGGLDRRMFAAALRLVAMQQSGMPLPATPVAAAMSPGANSPKLPPPRLNTSGGSGPPTQPAPPAEPAPQQQQPQAVARAVSSISCRRTASGVSGLDQLPQASPTATSASAAALPSLEVRLSPLNPKKAADVRLLGAAAGGLLASSYGLGICRLFQWARAEGNARSPDGEGVPSAEDGDMATAADIQDRSVDAATCIHADELSQVIWTGHKDGYVVAWRLGPSGSQRISRLHFWKAHRVTEVAAICSTYRGDLYTGSLNGSIRMWSPAKPGQLPNGATSRELRREQGARAHNDGILDLKISAAGEVMWSVGLYKVILWEASGGKYLGTLSNPSATANFSGLKINTREGLQRQKDGRIMTGGITRLASIDDDLSQQMDKTVGAVRNVAEYVTIGGVKKMEQAKKGFAMAAKFGSSIAKAVGKDKGKNSSGLDKLPSTDLNDINSDKSTSKEPLARTICCLAAALDGSFWLGYTPGLLEKYSPGGMMLWSEELKAGVCCLVPVGQHIWAGLMDGCINVYDAAGARLANWFAHRSAVVSMVTVGTRVFSLGKNGTVTGWSPVVPPDGWATLGVEWLTRLRSIVQRRSISVLAGTWNVNEQQPSQTSLNTWLGNRAKNAEIVIVGLQEIEMGTGSVAQAVVMDKFSLGEKGNVNAKWWGKAIAQTLASLEPTGLQAWDLVAMRQLSGMLLLVFARTSLAPYIGEVSTDSVGCGVLGVGGNKGGVAVGFSVFRSYVAVVNSHFAAHQKDVEKRNDNHTQISQSIRFGPVAKYEADETDKDKEEDEVSVDMTPSVQRGLQESDAVIWVGDFNYRVDMDRDEVVQAVKEDNLSVLLEADQCRREMAAGNTFVGMQEAPITFQPTYKFDKDTTNPYAYDSSEKRRVPSWTDRVFFRGSNRRGVTSPTAVSLTSRTYDACLDVIDSDHKPVFSLMSLDVPITDQPAKRRAASHVLKKALAEGGVTTDKVAAPLSMSTRAIHLSGDAMEIVILRNPSSEPVKFIFIGGEKEGIAIPLGLTIWPRSGVVPAKGAQEVTFSLTSFEDNSYIHASFEVSLSLLTEREMADGTDERVRKALGQKLAVKYSTW